MPTCSCFRSARPWIHSWLSYRCQWPSRLPVLGKLFLFASISALPSMGTIRFVKNCSGLLKPESIRDHAIWGVCVKDGVGLRVCSYLNGEKVQPNYSETDEKQNEQRNQEWSPRRNCGCQNQHLLCSFRICFEQSSFPILVEAKLRLSPSLILSHLSECKAFSSWCMTFFFMYRKKENEKHHLSYDAEWSLQQGQVLRLFGWERVWRRGLAQSATSLVWSVTLRSVFWREQSKLGRSTYMVV